MPTLTFSGRLSASSHADQMLAPTSPRPGDLAEQVAYLRRRRKHWKGEAQEKIFALAKLSHELKSFKGADRALRRENEALRQENEALKHQIEELEQKDQTQLVRKRRKYQHDVPNPSEAASFAESLPEDKDTKFEPQEGSRPLEEPKTPIKTENEDVPKE
ncbi:hypothetical protein TWF481_002691 [Arthrobotrys musiformis]|uniref:BZIP domain-containing protein n=1 Tax=Arthrobotrys musiformis TaxID=47236 RepID=A0AAV9VS11_9PEZI